jgi:tetratricopeptide (TPR) repeat protein
VGRENRGTISKGGDLVGRRTDLEELRRVVDDAIAGEGSIVLVVGEPGIGKTRLLEETAAYAVGAGAAVLRGSGWEGGGAPAYWPWIQIIRIYANRREQDTLVRELGASAAEVVRLVPELDETAAPPTSSSSEPDGDQARFRLFDTLSAFLCRAAEREPLILALDDLHWTDLGSLLLLKFLGRELRASRLAVVAAVRDAELDPTSDLTGILGELRRDHRTVLLEGLDPREVQELLAHEVGPHEAERLAADVHRRSGGNPLFVLELGRLLMFQRPGLGTGHVPHTIRNVLDRRLSRLSPDCVALLQVAAAIGEEFRTQILQSASGVSRDSMLELVDEALRARVLREEEAVAPSFAFVHPLFREVLYQQLPLTERVRTHERVAESLERNASADPPLAELAHHFLAAGSERGVDYAERAGVRSLEQFAFEDAAELFGRALEALKGDEDRRVGLLLRLGQARLSAGVVDEARETFETAASHARRLGREDVLAEAALGFSAGLGGIEIRMFDRAQIDLLEEALAALGPAESSLRARVMARLSIALTFAEPAERRRQLAEDAIASARRVGDPGTLVAALGAHCDAIAGPDFSEQRLAEADEMIKLSRNAGDKSMELLGRRHRVVALVELGEIPAVDAEVDAYASTAEAFGQPLYQWYVPMWRAMRAMMDGRLRECRELIEEVARVGSRAQSDNAKLLAEVLEWNLLRVEGRSQEVAENLREQLKLVDGVYGESFWVGLTAPAAFPAEAKAALGRLAPNDFAELPRDTIWLGGMSGVADACDVVRDVEVAEKVYEILLPYGRRFAIDGTATACYGSMSRWLGTLAAVLGRHETAAEHFEDALRAHRGTGAAALVAETLRAYGATLIESGDRNRGEALLREALAGFEELGMDVRVEQTAALLPTPARPNVFHREGESWELTYEGRTARFKDTKGIRDIAALLAAHGREVHVADLITAQQTGDRMPSVAADRGESVLDPSARAAYRDRLVELQEEVTDAESFGDAVRAGRAREQMDIIAGELASALGLGGRARRLGDPVERARKAVAQRVRNTLKRIEAEHPALARHLEVSLRMGSFCSYTPEHPVDWAL